VKSALQKTVMQVPMLDLSRQYASIRSEVLAAVERICDSQRYILSDEVAAFERDFAGLCGAREAVGCASGTDALWLALAAAGVGPGHDYPRRSIPGFRRYRSRDSESRPPKR